ncbi:MAG: DPP IV N-terminal domain-containing protein, partial [Cyclobacteriaceae bacterium]|nr:DPP IV N-terminal domain-containing protein [Cyclobacteriaceae bacterium]
MKNFVSGLFMVISLGLNAQNDPYLQAIDIFDLEYVSDPQISKQGDHILYVRNFKDIMTDRSLSNIWLADFNGNRKRPLTTGNQRDYSPRWSPDGSRVAYISNQDESRQIYKNGLDTGA